MFDFWIERAPLLPEWYERQRRTKVQPEYAMVCSLSNAHIITSGRNLHFRAFCEPDIVSTATVAAAAAEHWVRYEIGLIE